MHNSYDITYWNGKGKQETVEPYLNKSSKVYNKTHETGTHELWNSLTCKAIYIKWTEE